jgi:hypothetical protein
LHRWLNEGFIAGEQITPGAPWRIRLTDDIRALFVDDTPEGWLAMLEATLAYGVSRQTLMQRVKRGELQAVHVRTGRRKGLRIQPPTPRRPPILIKTISERSSVAMRRNTHDVALHRPLVAVRWAGEGADLGDRVLRAPVGAEPV